MIPEVKLLVLDVDGVMTDGGMYYTESGDQFKKFNTKDGIGIKMAQRQGTRVAFLSSGTNTNIINARAQTLGVELVYAGTDEKLGILSGWCKELGIAFDEVAYVGDDVNDLECINAVGLSACPSDAMDAVRSRVTVVLTNGGGQGCVREFIDNCILK